MWHSHVLGWFVARRDGILGNADTETRRWVVYVPPLSGCSTWAISLATQSLLSGLISAPWSVIDTPARSFLSRNEMPDQYHHQYTITGIQ